MNSESYIFDDFPFTIQDTIHSNTCQCVEMKTFTDFVHDGEIKKIQSQFYTKQDLFHLGNFLFECRGDIIDNDFPIQILTPNHLFGLFIHTVYEDNSYALGVVIRKDLKHQNFDFFLDSNITTEIILTDEWEEFKEIKYN